MQNNALQAIGARWRLSLRADVLQKTYASRVWREVTGLRRTRAGHMRGMEGRMDVTGTKSESARYPPLRPITETKMQNNALQAIGARWRLSLRADVR